MIIAGDIESLLNFIINDYSSILTFKKNELLSSGIPDSVINDMQKTSSWPETVNRSKLPDAFYSSLVANELFERIGVDSRILELKGSVINYLRFSNGNQYLFDLFGAKAYGPISQSIKGTEQLELLDLSIMQDGSLENKISFGSKGLIFNDKIMSLDIMLRDLDCALSTEIVGADSINKELADRNDTNNNLIFLGQIRNLRRNLLHNVDEMRFEIS